MWTNGFVIICCSLISLPICRSEAWSGHVCTTYWVTYFTERYCERYNWWTIAYGCKSWKTRQASKIGSAQYCCEGWKHNGNKICNILTDVTRVLTNASIITDESSDVIHIVKRQVNACGGYLTATTNTTTLKSPKFPSKYENNLYCTWTIEAPLNYVIVLHIEYLDLEGNRDCSYDYLSISLGRNRSLETNRICANETEDLSFITRWNETSVTFVTDRSGTKTGFSIEYHAVLNCGKHLTAQTWTETVTSPFYPSQYETNQNCHWTIEGPVNSTIVMQITYIDLEESTDCSHDYLQLYLGERYVSATDRICGSNIRNVQYISESNEADVIFVTDTSESKTGFSIQYYAVAKCGGHLKAEWYTPATLSSPYYPHQYDNNLHCLWTIESMPNTRIVIQILFTDLEENSDCSYDYLQIYLGDSNIFETSRICRNDSKDLNFITRSNKADVIFITDGSIQKTGVSLNYKSVALCGDHLAINTPLSSTLNSRRYPLQYERNLDCIWTFRAPSTFRIALQITYIDIQGKRDDCPFDFIQIYLGSHYLLKTKRICGNNHKGLTFISGSNEADVIFVTDASIEKTGFSLQYRYTSCGGHLTAMTAPSTLASPNYPLQYDNDLHCHWTIDVPINYRIVINITDIELDENSDCSYDYLQIYRGNNYILETDRICNEYLNFTSMSDEVHVIFITNGSITNRGFSLQYQAVLNCGGTLTAKRAAAKLTSPQYLFPVNNNLRCQWTLEAPLSYRIFIQITDIDFEENSECSEYLQLYLGTDYTFETDRICRNTVQDLTFITMSNKADVIFVTNGTRRNKTFSLQYRAVSYCGGHLMAETNISTLSSPNYPSYYENNLYCHWTIEAPVNYGIVINITNIDSEENCDCSNDYLQIFLGKNDIIRTYRICSNNTEDLAFVTISNQADVIYVTDGKLRFLLEYEAGTCYCEGESSHADCYIDLNEHHHNGFPLDNESCIKSSDDLSKPEDAGPAILDVKVLIPSVAGIVVAITIALGLWFYCRRRRTKRNKERTEQEPYTELQSTRTSQEKNYYEIVELPNNSSQVHVNIQTSDTTQDATNLYENMPISGNTITDANSFQNK